MPDSEDDDQEFFFVLLENYPVVADSEPIEIFAATRELPDVVLEYVGIFRQDEKLPSRRLISVKAALIQGRNNEFRMIR